MTQAKRRRPRNRDFRAWFNSHLRAYSQDIANHGADGGFPCITYTSDCCVVFDKYAPEIWQWLAEDADGAANVGALIAGFGRADMLGDWDTFRALLVWYACERVAHERCHWG